MKVCKRITAVLTAVILVILAAVNAGAITVKKDGREYILRTPTPTTGDVNVLMIRLGFADYSVNDEVSPADSEETLLSYFDGSKGSVNEFYETSSYGKLHLRCDKVYTYNTEHNRGDYAGAFSELSTSDLITEALTALDSEIDYKDYDSDGDGYLDVVCFDYAGPMGNWGETWWPHVSDDGNTEIEGKKVSVYSFLRGDAEIFKHEFGHIFGAADYYSYKDSMDYMIMTYDMMCMNIGDHNGFTKWSYGWLNDEDIVFADKASGDTEIKLAPIESPLGDGKKIAVIAPSFNSETRFLDEFFLVEYDTGLGNNKAVFDKYSFAPGFRIFHVNANANYSDASLTASFAFNNDDFGINLIHNMKNELEDPRAWDEGEMFFREGDALIPEKYPNTGLSSDTSYNGRFTGISFTDFVTGDNASFKVSFSDKVIEQPEPNLTLKNDNLTSDLRLSLSSDQPLVQKRQSAEDYEAPYLVDDDGTKLLLNISPRGTDTTRFDIRYTNVSPAIQSNKDYTLVIPEGYFSYGYGQLVPEFREKIKTESFLMMTQIEKYTQEIGMRYSNTFAVTDNTYGRIEMNADTASCDFIEFNLNGEEISRQTFSAPVTYETSKFLLGCSVYRLYDGNYAMCVRMIDRLHFFKLDKNADIISKVFTISENQLKGYINTVEDFKPVSFKGGLFQQLRSSEDYSQTTVIIDFENEPVFNNDDEKLYIPLDEEHYLIKSMRDNNLYLDIYNSSDALTFSVLIENNFMGAYIKDNKLHVMSRTIDYDEDYNRFITLFYEVYDESGKRLSREDISSRSQNLKNYYQFDRLIPTDSGCFVVIDNEFNEKLDVFVCDAEWNKLGEFGISRYNELEFLGECGLTTAYQYFEEECDDAYIISRFNIGDFEIVPKRGIPGDVNGDGVIDILDSTEIQKYAVEKVDFSKAQLELGDINGDGVVDILDATLIRKYAAGKIDKFPVEAA